MPFVSGSVTMANSFAVHDWTLAALCLRSGGVSAQPWKIHVPVHHGDAVTADICRARATSFFDNARDEQTRPPHLDALFKAERELAIPVRGGFGQYCGGGGGGTCRRWVFCQARCETASLNLRALPRWWMGEWTYVAIDGLRAIQRQNVNVVAAAWRRPAQCVARGEFDDEEWRSDRKHPRLMPIRPYILGYERKTRRDAVR